MKNTILIISIFTVNILFSQLVVEDPAAITQMANQVTKSIEMIDKMEDQVQTVKKQKEFIEKADSYRKKVNSVLDNLESTKYILEQTKESYDLAKELSQSIGSMNLSNDSKKSTLEQLEFSVKSIDENAKMLENLIREGIFKMDDNARIELIDKYQEKLEQEQE